jgi:hypothetical protein
MARSERSPLDVRPGAPLGRWSDRGGNLAALAAMIVRLPLRALVGLRNLSWGAIAFDTVGMLALQWFDNVHFSFSLFFGGGVFYGNHTALRNFAILWLGFAIVERFKRLDEERRGEEPHTLSPGVSRLGLAEILPLEPKIIAVAVEPALGFLAGAVLRRFGFSMLGWVIIVSSVCFSLTEWRLYQQTKEHRRDLRDLAKEGVWESDLMDDKPQPFNAGHSSDALSTDPETAQGGAS